ncbi:J domain-containing protein [Hymenobacter sp. B1770]|uniref:J domain-containing protein n=1 Tax=Hymenobacter sp. B1770 TaxID=1718788 RepID=UPI003CF763CA
MTHYQVLELPENASIAEIRRSYRRLVFITHPDRTPDPQAHARYFAINAAYEVLSDPSRRVAYDANIQPGASAARPTWPNRAREVARSTAWATRFEPAHVPFTVRHATAYKWTMRLLRPLLVVSLLLCASLALDYFLATESTETVVRNETTYIYTDQGSYQKTVHETNKGTFTLYNDLPNGARVVVRRTPLWGTATSARPSYHQREYPISSIYEGKKKIIWLGLLLMAALGLAPRLKSDHRLMASIAAVLLLVLTAFQILL